MCSLLRALDNKVDTQMLPTAQSCSLRSGHTGSAPPPDPQALCRPHLAAANPGIARQSGFSATTHMGTPKYFRVCSCS